MITADSFVFKGGCVQRRVTYSLAQ